MIFFSIESILIKTKYRDIDFKSLVQSIFLCDAWTLDAHKKSIICKQYGFLAEINKEIKGD